MRAVAVAAGIAALGFTNALVEWGAHHPVWLLACAALLLVCFCTATRTVRGEDARREADLPRPGVLPPSGGLRVHDRSGSWRMTRPVARRGP